MSAGVLLHSSAHKICQGLHACKHPGCTLSSLGVHVQEASCLHFTSFSLYLFILSISLLIQLCAVVEELVPGWFIQSCSTSDLSALRASRTVMPGGHRCVGTEHGMVVLLAAPHCESAFPASPTLLWKVKSNVWSVQGAEGEQWLPEERCGACWAAQGWVNPMDCSPVCMQYFKHGGGSLTLLCFPPHSTTAAGGAGAAQEMAIWRQVGRGILSSFGH